MAQIASAGELVRLHPDQADDGFCAIPELRAADALDRNFVDGFVEEMDSDIPGVAEALLLNKVFGKPSKASERIAREHAAPVADNVTVVVVLGGLDEVEIESLHRTPVTGSLETAGRSGGNKRGNPVTEVKMQQA